jgi:hypothetical protein
LLHPDFIEITLAAHSFFADSTIIILTNGVLLPKILDKTLEQFQSIGRIKFEVSIHIDTPEYNESIQRSVKRFQQFGFDLPLRPCNKRWETRYLYSNEGFPIPPVGNNPRISYQNCWGKECFNIVGDKLYSCSAISHRIHSVQNGALGKEWERVLSHQPMMLFNTQTEIEVYLNTGVKPECAMCLEQYERQESRQLSADEIRTEK